MAASGLLAGRYRLDVFLGSGNFGEVWAAEDTYLARQVAVKLFKTGMQPDSVLLEAQLQRRLSEHPHIAAIENVVLEPPRPFVVSELYARGSIAGNLGPDGAPPTVAMRWMRDLLAALAHAHGLGVVHRDVKPSNLLLGDDGDAVLTDFGIAEDTVRRLYVDRSSYAPHMAPELLAGGSTSPQSDLWAAACTWYRLLCGRYPFNSVVAVLGGAFEPLHHVNPQIPLAVSRAVARALEQNPADRYADAERMLAAVSGLIVENDWERIIHPGALEVWRMRAPAAEFVIRLTQRPRAGLELLLTRDLGNGPRKVLREQPTSLAKARQRLRALLVDGVTGKLGRGR